jgi:hypothetical protein
MQHLCLLQGQSFANPPKDLLSSLIFPIKASSSGETNFLFVVTTYKKPIDKRSKLMLLSKRFDKAL